MASDVGIDVGIIFRIHPFELVTDKRYGKPPASRTLSELLDSGFIAIDKPVGPSSHQVSGIVANILGIKKTAHLGTLDPNVSGVLPILLGKATKAVHYLMQHDKEYIGVAGFKENVNEKEVKEVFRHFHGDIIQIPPVGAAVARKPRKRHIYSIKIMDINEKRVRFRVRCEAGTYIRTLVDDMGKHMKNPAKLIELRRTMVGSITEKDLVTLDELREAVSLWKGEGEKGDETKIRRIVRPIEEITEGKKKIWVLDGAVDAICSGAQLTVPGIAKLSDDIEKYDIVCMMTLKGELVAFGTALMSSKEMVSNKKGTAVKISRVMMPRGTYPRRWK